MDEKHCHAAGLRRNSERLDLRNNEWRILLESGQQKTRNCGIVTCE